MRAKFKIQTIEKTRGTFSERDAEGNHAPVERDVYSVTMFPVYADSDGEGPNEENQKYWQATPAGMINLSTLNEAAVKGMKQGDEYYIDFKKA